MKENLDFPCWSSHRDALISHLRRNFFWHCPRFLTSEQVDILLSFAKKKEADGLFKPASIGKGDLKQVNTEIRSDQILWIENFDEPNGQLVQQIFSGLYSIARRDLFLPIKRFECHFAKYEKGSHYALHTDRHLTKPGRLISCVIYLSECEGPHGNLVLFDEALKAHSIRPTAGGICVFDSRLEHKVTPANKTRWSLTGWLRDDINPSIRL